ncbi:choice-of-anchor Q domain-containing protein [Leptolyngbya sp. 7M]|uniref:choice-of-anchor Q domain-containing protein n=1 Tax=Leptolyngbya sp. 7M TaxID=2812896 RepID=UPI001B8B5E79|nr:choice-of-anchor Q domain-containing protein [Leptolyngbya sp. 7M]QYO65779.1 putative Ig domain-containing protein [Leptolyngbya sp. 7M]
MRSLILTLVLTIFASDLSTSAAVYEVGPGQQITNIAGVPWATLQPGDIVRIHWRTEPYREKWVICRQGTAELPITVVGVPGPEGQRPVIDGVNATTPANLNFWSEQRGVIKIGGANVPADTMPRHIIIEGLEVRGAHPNYQFTGRNGTVQSYASAASPIFIEKGEFITIRNNIITDGANGLFAASTDSAQSRDILVEGNYIHGNGIVGSIYQHNNYTAAINITFQYNRFGPLRSGSPGVNLKDRSAGLVVRYNWIEGGNRTIDMVDGEDTAVIRNHPAYRKTFVYGNILIKQDGGNNQVVHYGGDSGTTANYRKGKLYLYGNTIYSVRASTTVIARLSTNDENADLRNNIFFNTSSGANLAMLAEAGTLLLANNWAKTGWRNSHEGGGFTGSVTGGNTMVTGTSPGFADINAQNFALLPGSPAIDAGTALNPDVLPLNDLSRQYLIHQRSTARPQVGQFDLGAFEYSALLPPVINTETLPPALRLRPYDQSLQITGGIAPFEFSIAEGGVPPGLRLDVSSGRIFGRPRLRGTWVFTIRVTDSQGQTAERAFTLSSILSPH